jgi:hypothetical protein
VPADALYFEFIKVDEIPQGSYRFGRFDRFLVQISDASTPLPDGTSRR